MFSFIHKYYVGTINIYFSFLSFDIPPPSRWKEAITHMTATENRFFSEIFFFLSFHCVFILREGKLFSFFLFSIPLHFCIILTKQRKYVKEEEEEKESIQKYSGKTFPLRTYSSTTFSIGFRWKTKIFWGLIFPRTSPSNLYGQLSGWKNKIQ